MVAAAVPSFVDQIRGLMNERAVLLTKRIEIDTQVSLIDAQLAEVRYILGDGAKPIATAVHVEPSPAAAAPTDAVQPLRAHDAGDGLHTLTMDKIVATVKATGPIAVKALADKLCVNHWTLRDRLSQLQVNGLIRFIGQGRGRRITLAGAPSPVSKALPSKPVAPASPVAAPLKTDDRTIEARDAAVLESIRRIGGVGTIRDLRLRFPKADPAAGNPSTLDEALRNSLSRLRSKGLIGRTADSYSLVGAGSEIGRG